ncbi:MAG: hypothetical protein ACR2QY_09910, partial [Akkermansiaceae bacterium]
YLCALNRMSENLRGRQKTLIWEKRPTLVQHKLGKKETSWTFFGSDIETQGIIGLTKQHQD